MSTGDGLPLDRALAAARAARKRAHAKAWYRTHRQEKLIYQRAYDTLHRAQIRARRKAARAARRAARARAAAYSLPLAFARAAAAAAASVGTAGLPLEAGGQDQRGRTPEAEAGTPPQPSVHHLALLPPDEPATAPAPALLPEDVERASAAAGPPPVRELALGLRVAGVRLQWRYRPDTQTWAASPQAAEISRVAAALAARRGHPLSPHAVDAALYPVLLALVRLALRGTDLLPQLEEAEAAGHAAWEAFALLDGDWPDAEAQRLAAEARAAVARLCAHLSLV